MTKGDEMSSYSLIYLTRASETFLGQEHFTTGKISQGPPRLFMPIATHPIQSPFNQLHLFFCLLSPHIAFLTQVNGGSNAPSFPDSCWQAANSPERRACALCPWHVAQI